MIGRFLEISIHTPDILASLEFYERLGFTQLTTGDAWPYPYAVVTDGRLAIGLHQRELPQSLLLSFVLPELFRHVDRLERRGIEFLTRRLGGDVFNEATFETPGGYLIRLLEARTFSPSRSAPGAASRLGWFEEIALPVDDLKAAAGFWESLGFAPVEEGEDPLPHIGLTSDSLNVTLVHSGTLGRPALLFTDAGMAERVRTLEDGGIEFVGRLPAELDSTRHRLLVAPEGTQLLLVTAD